MNAKQLIAVLAILSAGTSAFAQSSEYVTPNTNFVSSKTRAEVIAELKQAKAEGTYIAGGEEYQGQFPALAKSQRNRTDAIESAQNKKPVANPNGG